MSQKKNSEYNSEQSLKRSTSPTSSTPSLPRLGFTDPQVYTDVDPSVYIASSNTSVLEEKNKSGQIPAATKVQVGDLIVVKDPQHRYSGDAGKVESCDLEADEYVVNITHLKAKEFVNHTNKVTLKRCQFETREEQLDKTLADCRVEYLKRQQKVSAQ